MWADRGKATAYNFSVMAHNIKDVSATDDLLVIWMFHSDEKASSE